MDWYDLGLIGKDMYGLVWICMEGVNWYRLI